MSEENNNYSLLLADDDDDRKLFKYALEEVPLPITFNTTRDGVDLMKYLTANTGSLPDVLFLDLNMPMKNGSECLTEIKENDALKKLAVVIFSTSLNPDVADLLYENGAHYYIRKPALFDDLVKVIHKAITILSENNYAHPAKEDFILKP